MHLFSVKHQGSPSLLTCPHLQSPPNTTDVDHVRLHPCAPSLTPSLPAAGSGRNSLQCPLPVGKLLAHAAWYRVSGPFKWVLLPPGSSACLAPWTGHPTFAILRVECVRVSQKRIPRNQLWLGGWRDMSVGRTLALYMADLASILASYRDL